MAILTGDYPVAAADVLDGTGAADTISGLTLADTLSGFGGANTLDVFGRTAATFAAADVFL